MPEYEWCAQWRDDEDSWLRYSGWQGGNWESEEKARKRYEEYSKLRPTFSAIRLVRRIKPGAIEVIDKA